MTKEASYDQITVTHRFLQQLKEESLTALQRVQVSRSESAVAEAAAPVEEEIQSLAERAADEEDELTEEEATRQRSELLAAPIEVEPKPLDDSILEAIPASVFERFVPDALDQDDPEQARRLVAYVVHTVDELLFCS